MLLNEIQHKSTLKSIQKHNIPIEKYNTIDELRYDIQLIRHREWNHQNREYFRLKMNIQYHEKKKKQKELVNYFKELPNITV